MTMKRYLLTLLAFALLTLPCAAWAVVAFPGAEGYGSTTRHAYAGTGDPVIYVVNTLADNATQPAASTRNGVTVYTGSLRACLTDTTRCASGTGRIVVFEVSGTIDLTTTGDIVIVEPYGFIAGQTSPSPGINLRGASIEIRDHDWVIQHIRSRVGDAAGGEGYDTRRAWQAIENGVGVYDIYNIVLDHVSGAWSTDILMSIFDSDTGGSGSVHDITVSNSILTEPLVDSEHSKGSHGYGFEVTRAENIAVLRNIIAHATLRNPQVSDSTTLLANNLIFNPAYGMYFRYQYSYSVTNRYVAAVGNYFRSGGNPCLACYRFYNSNDSYVASSSLYLSDNVEHGSAAPADQWAATNGTQRWMTDPASAVNKVTENPMTMTGITIWSGADVLTNLFNTTPTSTIDSVGARPINRDAVDSRLVTQVNAGTGTQIDDEDDVGGWPALPEFGPEGYPFDMPADPHTDSGNGYSYIEKKIYEYAQTVEGRATDTPPPDPPAATTDWSHASVYGAWRFETGGFLADSSDAANTLTDAGSKAPDEDTVDFKEGVSSANFETDNDDYLTIADASLASGTPMKSGETNKRFIVGGWFKPESTGADNTLIGKYGGSGDYSWRIALHTGDAAGRYPKLQLGFNSGTQNENIVHTTLVAPGNWYGICVAYDDSDKSYRINLYDANGDSLGTDKTTPAPTLDANKISVTGTALTVGSAKDGAGNFDGRMDMWFLLRLDLISGTVDEACDSLIAGTYEVPAASAPTVTSATVLEAGTSVVTPGTKTIEVNTSHAVAVSGDTSGTKITLNTTPTRYAYYSYGSPGTTLYFSVTFEEGDRLTAGETYLDYTGTDQLVKGNATIQDSNGRDLTLTLPTVGGASSVAAEEVVVAIPRSISNPFEICDSGCDYATWALADVDAIAGDHFVYTATATETILLDAEYTLYNSIITSDQTLQITSADANVYFTTIKGILDIDAAGTFTSVACPGDVDLAAGLTITPTNCAFLLAEATIEAEHTATITPTNCVFEVADMGFTNEAGGVFTLVSGSAIKDAGLAVTGITADLAGNPIPQGSAPAIGAYDYVPANTLVALTVGTGTYDEESPLVPLTVQWDVEMTHAGTAAYILMETADLNQEIAFTYDSKDGVTETWLSESLDPGWRGVLQLKGSAITLPVGATIKNAGGDDATLDYVTLTGTATLAVPYTSEVPLEIATGNTYETMTAVKAAFSILAGDNFTLGTVTEPGVLDMSGDDGTAEAPITITLSGDWTVGGALTIGDYTDVTLDGNDLTVSGAVVLGAGSSISGGGGIVDGTGAWPQSGVGSSFTRVRLQ